MTLSLSITHVLTLHGEGVQLCSRPGARTRAGHRRDRAPCLRRV